MTTISAKARSAWALGAIIAVACWAMHASLAQATVPSFTWAGHSTSSAKWSDAGNWAGGIAPTSSENIGTLAFPRLTSVACTIEEESHPCYISDNDLTGLTAEALQIDDGDSYVIGGEPVTLGSDGLTASPGSGATGPAGDFMLMPLKLSSSQTWSITGAASIGSNGVFFGGDITGLGSALTLELGEGPGVYLENSTEVGPLKIDGANTAQAGVFNGFVALEEGELNSSDLEPVSVGHILMFAAGAVGPLTTDHAELSVGSGVKPAGSLEAPSVKLDSASHLGFEISGAGATPRQDYSQLLSTGSVDLEGASFEVVLHPPEEGKPCPSLVPGTTYTFISTTGQLSGAFANAPEHGAEVPIRIGQGCAQSSHKLRIGYHTTGATETVTGTVDAELKEAQEREAKEGQEREAKERNERERQEREVAEREASRNEEALNQQHARQAAEEVRSHEQEAASATAKRQEEEVAAVRKSQEEAAARGGVLSAKEGVPDATLASASLQASGSGAVPIKISCPTGESSCTGTVTLRTLSAVSIATANKKTVLNLAAGPFTVPGGSTRTIVLHLSAKARALLARLHVLRVRAAVLARDPAGATHASQAIATLHAPKTRHHQG
jgi:hypothetical protein